MESPVIQDDIQAGARWAPAMRALGDERLARMVENGSDSAFAAIYGRYAPVLHGYCRSLLRDEEEAGDALQNAMLKALQAMRRAGRSGPLRPWLFRIAHNESVTIIRQRTRRPAPLEESMVAGADDSFRRAAAREQLAALLADMQNLTEHQRGALVMRELGGLTYDEIGSALDTTPLAARQAVFVARRRLSDGPAGPRKLRPALQLLIGPAPAGFVLFGAIGGGVGAKALVATAAAVSIGVGSVELVVQTEPEPKREVAAAAPQKKAVKRPATPAAKSAATASASAPRAEVRRTSAPAATPAPAQIKTATVRFIEAKAKAPEPTEREPEPTPAPTAAPPAERPARPERHRPAPQPAAPAEPAPSAPAPTPAPEPPTYERRPVSGYTAHTREGRDCPPEAAEPSADGESVAPVQ